MDAVAGGYITTVLNYDQIWYQAVMDNNGKEIGTYPKRWKAEAAAIDAGQSTEMISPFDVERLRKKC